MYQAELSVHYRKNTSSSNLQPEVRRLPGEFEMILQLPPAYIIRCRFHSVVTDSNPSYTSHCRCNRIFSLEKENVVRKIWRGLQ